MDLIIKSKSGIKVSENTRLASTMEERMIGLMFKKKMDKFDGLMLEPCQSIHTFFMRFAIDVIFLNRENKIIKIIRNMKPWRLTWFYWRSYRVLEMAGGKFPKDLNEGEELTVQCIS